MKSISKLTFIASLTFAALSLSGNPTKSMVASREALCAEMPADVGIVEVEYLESTGTQWIDTEVYGNEQLSMRMSIMTLQNGGDKAIIGADNGSAFNGAYNLMISSQFRFIRNNKYVNTAISGKPHINPQIGVQYDIEVGPAGILVEENLYPITDTTPFQTKGTLPLFAWRRNNNIIVRGILRCKHLAIWEGTDLIRDFYPVRFVNNHGISEGAMYDAVSGNLFRNQGTGSFIIGPDKEVE